MVKGTQIALKCIFCGSTKFELPEENYEPKEDENIKCDNCGKLNIHADLKEICINEGRAFIESELKKNIEKKYKHIKFK
jgi:DNA-directed RNA polymerase subunit RPC12/RpoP|tara:strand:- start:23636 stop:23872 length:237 start_codon:yes stop_codon:yes gene_type:complete